MGLIPVDLKLGKMLLFGAILKCIDPILTIAGFHNINSSLTFS
jgi:HrpA-like RNA helicase